MATEKVLVPDLGGAGSVEVIEISVAPGDRVELEQSLVVLESDKATMDVPSTKAGVVKSILVNEGDTVSEGSAIVELELESADSAEPEPVKEEVSEAEETSEPNTDEKLSADAEAKPKSNTQQIVVPDIGSDGQVDVIEVNCVVGDQISEGDTLLVLESDKATMEVPAPYSGELTELVVKEGDKLAAGDAIGTMNTVAEAVADTASKSESKAPVDFVPESKPESEPKAASESVPVPAAKPESDTGASGDAHAGPAVRLLARELGVSLQDVTPTGPRDRILKEDVDNYVKNLVQQVKSGSSTSGGAAIPAVPAVDFSQFGEIETIKMSKIAKVTAANMQRSWLNVPHVTQFDDADITELEAFRKSMKAEAEKQGAKLTPIPFLLKVCAVALQQNPEFNRSLHSDGEHIVQKHYIHIGMAVDTPRGLVVPVIRNVDKKGLWELSKEVLELAGKARDGKLTPAEMQGGCFTISSLGAIGGKGFTPIVNAPEVGILGVSKAEIKPVWNGSEFAPRQMLPLSLSYDHRVINGGDAGRFMTTLVSLIGDIRRLLL